MYLQALELRPLVLDCLGPDDHGQLGSNDITWQHTPPISIAHVLENPVSQPAPFLQLAGDILTCRVSAYLGAQGWCYGCADYNIPLLSLQLITRFIEHSRPIPVTNRSKQLYWQHVWMGLASYRYLPGDLVFRM